MSKIVKAGISRKILFMMCIVALVVNTMAFAQVPEKEVQVIINGDKISFENSPLSVNGRILVPFRAIFEQLGFEVSWDNAIRKASGNNGNQIVSFIIDDPCMEIEYADSTKISKTIDVPAKAENGRTYIPLRALSESIGADVVWDNENYTVNISYMPILSEENESQESVNIFETDVSFEEYMEDVQNKFDCSYDFAVFVSNDSTLFAWGNNDSGQLISDVVVLREPTIIQRNVKKACCMKKSTVVLYLDGSVSIYGEFASKLFDKNIVDIECGDDYIVALDNNGTSYIWGTGAGKMLGYKNLIVDEPVAFMDNIVSISGDRETIVLQNKDKVISIIGSKINQYTKVDKKSKIKFSKDHDIDKYTVYKLNHPVDSYRITDGTIIVNVEERKEIIPNRTDVDDLDYTGIFSNGVEYRVKDGNLFLGGNICNSTYDIKNCVLEEVALIKMMGCGTYVVILNDGSLWTFGVSKNGSLGNDKNNNTTFPEIVGYIDTTEAENNKYGIKAEIIDTNCFSDEYVISVAFTDKTGQPVKFYGMVSVVIATEYGDLYENNHFISENSYGDENVANISLNPKKLLSKVSNGAIGLMLVKANTLIYAYGDADELPEKSKKDSNDVLIGGSTGDRVESMIQESNRQKYTYYDSIVKSLEEQLRSVMSQRDTRVYSGGRWIYTYDHSAAEAIESDINYYKKIRDMYR